MRRRIRPRLKRADGRPASYAGVLVYTAQEISAASDKGKGLYLSAEMVRALDWAVIRTEFDAPMWRECGRHSVALAEVSP